MVSYVTIDVIIIDFYRMYSACPRMQPRRPDCSISSGTFFPIAPVTVAIFWQMFTLFSMLNIGKTILNN